MFPPVSWVERASTGTPSENSSCRTRGEQTSPPRSLYVLQQKGWDEGEIIASPPTTKLELRVVVHCDLAGAPAPSGLGLTPVAARPSRRPRGRPCLFVSHRKGPSRHPAQLPWAAPTRCLGAWTSQRVGATSKPAIHPINWGVTRRASIPLTGFPGLVPPPQSETDCQGARTWAPADFAYNSEHSRLACAPSGEVSCAGEGSSRASCRNSHAGAGLRMRREGLGVARRHSCGCGLQIDFQLRGT